MDYKVKDIGLADFGRKEIEIAEQDGRVLLRFQKLPTKRGGIFSLGKG